MRRRAAIHWSALVFLIVFTVLLIVIVYTALVPGVEAAKDASPQEKRTLVAWYRLLLAVLLFILFAGLVLTFRFGRLFFPRATGPRVKTEYVDAWAESAKRVEVPPEEDS